MIQSSCLSLKVCARHKGAHTVHMNNIPDLYQQHLILFLLCRLGFQYRFAIIHDNGYSELEIEEYFLTRLRWWREHRGQYD